MGMPVPSRKEALVVDTILDLLLQVPWQRRSEVIQSIQHNDIFCWECGMGDDEHPNSRCQCWNDE
jgi:hypothetical protein